MRDALGKSGRPIYYSISKGDPMSYAGAKGQALANSWRTSIKVRDGWNQMKANFLLNNDYQKFAKPGAWNDPDLLYVGLGWLSAVEEQTQFALWCLAKAPLLLSTDLTALTPQQVSLLTNPGLLAVNQDPTSTQGGCVSNCFHQSNRVVVYGGPQNTGVQGKPYFAAVAVNWGDRESEATDLDFRLIDNIVCKGCFSALDVQCDVYDLMSGFMIGTYRNVMTTQALEPHTSIAYKFKCKYIAVQ
jgi:alpha-galactosidase